VKNHVGGSHILRHRNQLDFPSARLKGELTVSSTLDAAAAHSGTAPTSAVAQHNIRQRRMSTFSTQITLLEGHIETKSYQVPFCPTALLFEELLEIRIPR
jgi:hypothetical protein